MLIFNTFCKIIVYAFLSCMWVLMNIYVLIVAFIYQKIVKQIYFNNNYNGKYTVAGSWAFLVSISYILRAYIY